jgi:hypothetical protein
MQIYYSRYKHNVEKLFTVDIKLHSLHHIHILGRAIAQAVSRRPLTAAARVRARVSPVVYVVDKVALGLVFLRVLRFSPVNIIPPWAPHFRKLKKNSSSTHSFSSGDEQWARKSGRSSVRRQSHPHNQNTHFRRRISLSIQIAYNYCRRVVQATQVISHIYSNKSHILRLK